MTRALPFTEAGLRRRSEAARKAGLRVTEIKADGTIVTEEAAKPEPEHLEPKVDVVF